MVSVVRRRDDETIVLLKPLQQRVDPRVLLGTGARLGFLALERDCIKLVEKQDNRVLFLFLVKGIEQCADVAPRAADVFVDQPFWADR